MDEQQEFVSEEKVDMDEDNSDPDPYIVVMMQSGELANLCALFRDCTGGGEVIVAVNPDGVRFDCGNVYAQFWNFALEMMTSGSCVRLDVPLESLESCLLPSLSSEVTLKIRNDSRLLIEYEFDGGMLIYTLWGTEEQGRGAWGGGAGEQGGGAE